MTRHTQDFIKILEKLCPSRGVHETFSDWLMLAAASLYSWKKDPAAEAEYFQTAKNYTDEELEKHGQLLAITVDALDRKEQDFLGEIFSEINLTNPRTGQFFTPYSISLLSAKIILGSFPENRICRINEPACGSGGMVIASIEVMKERGFDFQHNAYFVCQDIDGRCARMTYIQLSLLGAPAVIICGNTITQQTYWYRETIGYHISGMDLRLRLENMLDIIRKTQAAPAEDKEEKPPMKITMPRGELVQGELF